MTLLETHCVAIPLAANTETLALPPGSCAVVSSWLDHRIGCVPEFEVELWAETAVAVTSAVLYGARKHAYAFSDITLTSVTHATNLLTKNGHGLETGDGPIYFQAGTTYPTGLSATTQYWFIKIDANTGKLAASLDDALAGTPVDFSSAGSGTLKLLDSETAGDLTQRLSWATHDGLLGLAGDGAISLNVGQGYSKRVPHSPLVVAYALVASVDDPVWASLFPIQDR